ncbi:MAG: acyl-CoA thioesterase [Pseudomonadota bacterium]|nr:acyl-CoA thioesterase [Pseudomonadota bacterium]
MLSSHLTFQFLAEPTDINFGGNVHGGMVMKWIDQAAYACAAQWSGKYCITISANGIRFIRPIKVGQMVRLDASVVHTGRSSMHIYVVVKAIEPKVNEQWITNRCFISFMAVNEHGEATAVPMYTPQTEEDFQLELVAMHAKNFAKQLDNDFEQSLNHSH